MKNTLLHLLALLALACAFARAADDRFLTALRAADDERLAATKSADPKRLDAIFSDELHYAHSNGKLDTKASYMKSLTTRNTIYESFDYVDRTFTRAGPGIAIMRGRVLVKAVSNGEKLSNDLNFLAVWREEGGKWRFLAWQSCKNPPTDTAKK